MLNLVNKYLKYSPTSKSNHTNYATFSLKFLRIFSLKSQGGYEASWFSDKIKILVLFTLTLHNQRISVLNFSPPCMHRHIPNDLIVINCANGDLVKIMAL